MSGVRTQRPYTKRVRVGSVLAKTMLSQDAADVLAVSELQCHVYVVGAGVWIESRDANMLNKLVRKASFVTGGKIELGLEGVMIE